MQTINSIIRPFAQPLLFKEKGYTAEMCITETSLRQAFQLRYRAYRNAGAIECNSEELCTDPYDAQRNTRTCLIRYEGRPVASVRSLIWSAAYGWDWTPSVKYFNAEVDQHLGRHTPLLETNRYVVDPTFKGRKSLAAQMLMYRIQTLVALAEGCEHVIMAVRPRHTPFYRRMMDFKIISEPIKVSEVSFSIQLMTTPIASRKKLAQSSNMAASREADQENYRWCLCQLNSK